MGEHKDRSEVESLAKRFAKAVVRKNVHGKLPAGSKINGVEIKRSYAGGFYDHGPDQMFLSPLESKVSQLHTTIYQEQNKLPELVNSHVVSVVPSVTDRRNAVLTIHFFQDRKQVDGRGWCTPAHVSTELPGGVMAEFLGTVSRNPDLLEDFYQRTFMGLDSEGGLPGMRRTKVDGFYLISGDRLLEAGKVGAYDTEGVNRFFGALEKHHYQNGPYGTGDTFQPR